ncbi:MAG: flagellar assembly protein FliW [Oscillospiraceae bacterium]|jgi:flagellar assembly factor FliW|nr:flagellar assembly protein FliW [Oscillospiraceae bacterium]
MTVTTSRFGEIDIAQSKIIDFPEGIPGFEECSRFALITAEETDPFLWLQALDMPEIALAVVNPFRLFPDYAPRVPEAALAEIGSPANEDVLLLAVAVIPGDPQAMSANLVSPLIINAAACKGKQVILEGTDYLIRQPIFEPVRALMCGEG